MTANANTKARIREYRALIKETARELKQPPTAEIVRHLVAFRMMRDAIQARLLTGTITNTDADALMKVNEVLKSFLPQGAPMDVTLNIMAPGDVTCPCGCGHRFNPRTNKTVVPPEPPPASPKPLERVAERAEADVAPSTSKPKRQPAPPSVSESGFHDQVVNGARPPLKRLQPSWNANGEPVAATGADRGLVW